MKKNKIMSFNNKWLLILPIVIFFLYISFVYAFVDTEIKRHFLSLSLIRFYSIISAILLFFLIIVFAYLFIKQRKKLLLLKPKNNNNIILSSNIYNDYLSIKKYLKSKYGFFWKYKTKIVIIFGSKNNIMSLSSDFSKKLWKEERKTVFLWIENERESLSHEEVIGLCKVRNPFADGIVWVTSFKYLYQDISTKERSSNINDLYKSLKVKIPFYIWLTEQQANQEKPFSQPIYCSLPSNNTTNTLQNSLYSLIPSLIVSGTEYLIKNHKNTFLLRFAQTLEKNGTNHIINNFKSFFNKNNLVDLSGIMFSQSLARNVTYNKDWFKNTNWETISNNLYYSPPKRLGLSKTEKLQIGCLSLILLWGIGSVCSYFVNKKAMFKDSLLAYQAINKRLPTAQGLLIQKQLQQDIEHKQFIVKHGAVWYSRFGLNQNTKQLNALWPYYKLSNNRLMQTAIATLLHKKLSTFTDKTQQSANTLQAKEAYDLLKAYLMMAKPEKMDTFFWKNVVFQNWQERDNVTQGIWENTAPSLLSFYANNFPNHPEWVTTLDIPLINKARGILIQQIGNHKVEEVLYNNIIKTISPHFSNLELKNIANNTDVNQLFLTKETIPGIYTRQAWEKEVKNAIDQAVQTPRQNVDWVLSDSSEEKNNHTNNKALKQLLTQHYFNDFQKKWAVFLNSIQWRQSRSIDDTISQLTLFTDIKRSPFIALINTINYQGKAGKQTEDIPGSLIQSTRKMFWNDKDDAINQKITVSYPMDDTFGPLFAIIEGKAGGDGATNINLQSFLTKVTLLRLKLQQIAKIKDPRAVNNMIFQEKDEQLTETNQYSQLMVAFIGDSLEKFGDTLFIKPIEQTKQSVMQPASENMNNSWKKNIADEWNKAFSNKYPFAPQSENDVSFDLLGQYLRPDTGRLDQFIQSQLGHLLHKEGNTWVVDPMASDGLVFNPKFLQAINQLNQLSEALFISPDNKFHFEIQALPSPKIIRSEFSIDNQQVIYFNQADTWQLVDWPGDDDVHGASLSIVDYSSKLKNLAEYDDKLGIIRLLEQAKIEQLDSNIYQLTWNLPNSKETITYLFRNDAGKGILTLLDLKNFQFPAQIFEKK